MMIYYVTPEGKASPLVPPPRSRMGVGESEIAGVAISGFWSIGAERVMRGYLWEASPKHYQSPLIARWKGGK